MTHPVNLPASVEGLSPKHIHLAHLLAMGLTHAQASRALTQAGVRIGPHRISMIRQQPHFQAYVRYLAASTAAETMQAIVGQIAREAEPSVRRLADLRDCAEREEVRYRAASRLLESFEHMTGLKRAGDEGREAQIPTFLQPAEEDAFRRAMKEAGLTLEVAAQEVLPALKEPEPPEGGEDNGGEPGWKKVLRQLGAKPGEPLSVEVLRQHMPKSETWVEGPEC